MNTFSMTFSLPLTAMVSVTTGQGRNEPSASRTLAPSGPRVSRNRSVLSVNPAVTPHEQKPLCPMMTGGAPANVAPGHSQSDALKYVEQLTKTMPVGYRAVLGGASVAFRESRSSLIFALFPISTVFSPM